MDKKFFIGMDVGSTTVKAVVVDQANDQILWSDYQRHDTKQPEKVLEFLKRFDTEIEGFNADQSRIFITGSGGNATPRRSDYQRHDTKQPEKVLEFLKRFDTEIEGFNADQSRIFITGSGGNGMSKYL